MDRIIIPNEVKHFILGAVPSIPYLEAILLLKSMPQHYWSISELSKRLFITESATETIVKQLLLAGIIVFSEHEANLYHYHPSNEKLTALINQVAELYTTNLVEITNLIHSKSENTAQKFSDAFILRKDK